MAKLFSRVILSLYTLDSKIGCFLVKDKLGATPTCVCHLQLTLHPVFCLDRCGVDLDPASLKIGDYKEFSRLQGWLNLRKLLNLS